MGSNKSVKTKDFRKVIIFWGQPIKEPTEVKKVGIRMA